MNYVLQRDMLAHRIGLAGVLYQNPVVVQIDGNHSLSP